MRVREILERDSAKAPPWQRRLLFGHRWPVRVAAALCLGVVLVSDTFVLLTGALVLAMRVLLVALVIWSALADALVVLRLAIDIPENLPRWLRRTVDVWWQYPCRPGFALGCGLANLVPIFLAFPTLPGSALAYGLAALLLIGLAPVGFSMLLMLAIALLAIPIAIPIGIVNNIRNRRDRRYREIYRYRGHPPW